LLICLKTGEVVLKGIVASQEDSDIATLAANQVPDVFSIKNELQVEGRVKKPIS
jgi:osmotically-inducible protein OsmY